MSESLSDEFEDIWSSPAQGFGSWSEVVSMVAPVALGVRWFEVLRQERDQIQQLEYMSTPSWFQVFQSASELLYSGYQKAEVKRAILVDTPHFVQQENDAIVPHTSLADLKQWSLTMGEVENKPFLGKERGLIPSYV